MKKGLQKILLLFAIVTVIAHSTLPHLHHDEIPAISQQHHHDEQPVGHHPFDADNNTQDNQHRLFSFAQLDENFVPVNNQNNSFELPLTYLSAFLVTYLSDGFPVNTKTHFGCYKVFPPPEKYFPSSSHRGPPTV
jgi:hypothetical protein